MEGRFIVSGRDETRALAENFLNDLHGNEFISLTGNLGAGKTFFVKILGEIAGLKGVSSPTFAILNYYEGGKINLYHYDFYRIKKAEELYDIGFYENLDDDSAVKIAEWADLFPEAIPSQHISVSINLLDNNDREYTFKHIR
ncbi:MAG: tRNA (adenosine(37)-N6)-threonylcarbamoyltransferase complex ATPase subunit type 1 TsaE [Ignavibacteriaceae bacterium]|nr:tRNA (adenosine(37)-N6)-threonylcarbamoyltransferase complex ATPase subunit type 1 TsaE [Ignavibacteriaceae bacterium]NUM71587.1 tRNA (adenosine(37)-N6)-threonylcarbamoyltransferase complex ATPase subunit type 1 TsaE [Ignavibacteriaceae bacterium]